MRRANIQTLRMLVWHGAFLSAPLLAADPGANRKAPPAEDREEIAAASRVELSELRRQSHACLADLAEALAAAKKRIGARKIQALQRENSALAQHLQAVEAKAATPQLRRERELRQHLAAEPAKRVRDATQAKLEPLMEALAKAAERPKAELAVPGARLQESAAQREKLRAENAELREALAEAQAAGAMLQTELQRHRQLSAQAQGAFDAQRAANASLRDRVEQLEAEAAGREHNAAMPLAILQFDRNSREPDGEFRQLLATVKLALGEDPDRPLDLIGHTCNTGNAAANLHLSKRRAEGVRKLLIDAGIAADRLRARGAGDAQPIADNATAEGRRLNRRVEIRLGS